ncbi:MAG TPA: hypothetical protein VGX24_02465 [Pyrinomonadaceae bacterium]|jgi:hypothetical protein|nr:hypothetical protein [Pyrinomonadaceae bacterium]
MNKRIFIGLSFAICLCVVAASAQKDEKSKSTTKKSDHDHIQINGSSLRWEHRSTDEGTDITLTSKNVEFNDDYTDVERITGDGYFRLSEERGGMLRRLEMTPGTDGQLKRQYWERGEVRPWNDAARKWLARLLSDTVAGSGYDAEARVRRILRKGGANAVLAEITRLKTDYARRVYSTALVEGGNLSGEQLMKLLSQSSKSIASDYEKATLLIQVLKNNLADASVRAAFFETANTISSDYERGRVLAVLLKRSDISTETLLLALKATRGMSSDFEKANVLIRAAGTGAANESVRSAIIEAAHALSSDYERGRVLTAVTKKQL